MKAYYFANERDDLAQEAAIAEWQAESSYNGRIPLSAWKGMCARHARVDYIRRVYGRGKRKVFLPILEDCLAAESSYSFEPRLYRAMASLHPTHQRILYLKYWLEMPEAEIGKELGMHPHTVRTHLTRRGNTDGMGAYERLRLLLRRAPALSKPETARTYWEPTAK